MLKGNTRLKIEKLNAIDKYGQATVSGVSYSMCCISKFIVAEEKTPRRITASEGNATEFTDVVRLLVELDSGIAIGDRVTVGDLILRVTVAFRRYDAIGKADHIQTDCVTWA